MEWVGAGIGGCKFESIAPSGSVNSLYLRINNLDLLKCAKNVPNPRVGNRGYTEVIMEVTADLKVFSTEEVEFTNL